MSEIQVQVFISSNQSTRALSGKQNVTKKKTNFSRNAQLNIKYIRTSFHQAVTIQQKNWKSSYEPTAECTASCGIHLFTLLYIDRPTQFCQHLLARQREVQSYGNNNKKRSGN